MKTLFIINRKVPKNHRIPFTLIKGLQKTEEKIGILFIQNGVYNEIESVKDNTLKDQDRPVVNIYFLKPDMLARGLENKIKKDAKLVDYDGFLDLVVNEYERIVNW